MLALYQKVDPLSTCIDWQSAGAEKLIQINVTAEATESVSGNSGNSGHTAGSATESTAQSIGSET